MRVDTYLELIDQNAEQLYPEWRSLPKVDPLKTLAGFVAVIAADLRKDMDTIEAAISAKLPAIFGVRPQSATAATSFVRLVPHVTHQSPAVIPAGLRITAKKALHRVRLRTLHDICLFDFGAIEVEQDDDHLWIGMERIPVGTSFSLFIDCQSGDSTSSSVSWKIANSKGLDDLEVIDRTHNLNKAGLITLSNPPLQAKAVQLFGKSRYWIAAQLYDHPIAPVKRVMANVADVANIISYKNYAIGSGRGLPSQRIRLPDGQLLRCQELKVFDSSVGDEHRWTLKSSLLASTMSDRHYTYDHQSNELVFGDGRQGCILPPGYDNVWASDLELTQGADGNLELDADAEVEQPDWRISAVNLLVPLVGGTNHSASDDLLHKMHEVFHHKERAVSLRDFERLSPMASPRIGLAFASNPSFGSVVVIPVVRPEFSNDPETLDYRPDASDIDALTDFLEQRRALNINLSIRPPRYRRILITGNIQIMGSKDVNLSQIRDLITKYFSPYRQSESKLRPGSKIELSAVLSYVRCMHHVANISELHLIDEQSGVSVDYIQLGFDELPKVSVKLRFDEVGL